MRSVTWRQMLAGLMKAGIIWTESGQYLAHDIDDEVVCIGHSSADACRYLKRFGDAINQTTSVQHVAHVHAWEWEVK